MSKINIRSGLESLTLDATLDVACLLIERHVETTNKEIKDVLRKRGYFATEAMVSGFMEQGYKDWGLKRKVFNDGERSYYVYMTDYDSEFTKQLLKEQEEEKEEEFFDDDCGSSESGNVDRWARFETDDDDVSFFHYPTDEDKVKPSVDFSKDENSSSTDDDCVITFQFPAWEEKDGSKVVDAEECETNWIFGKESELNEDTIRSLNDMEGQILLTLDEKTKTKFDVVYKMSSGYYDIRYFDMPNKVINGAIRIGSREHMNGFKCVFEIMYKGYPVFYAGLNADDILISQIKYVAYKVLCNEILLADFYSIHVKPLIILS